MKSFGPKGKTLEPAPREPFEFTVTRDEQPETHEFMAVGNLDAAGLAQMMSSTKRPEGGLTSLFRLIAKMLDNRDGTPTRWTGDPLPRPEDDPDAPLKFRAPDGSIQPIASAAEFAAFDAGSSRRRWLYLMEEDEEVIVNAEDLLKLFEWLVSVAARRPTLPSS